MEGINIQTLIAGAIVPFIISLLKRWIKLSKDQISLVVIVVCFLVASIFELIETEFNFTNYLSKIAEVYGASQIIYWTVIKSLELDEKIEGTN